MSEYHPENAVPGKTSPPTLSAMPHTAGSAYHFRPSAANSGHLFGEVEKRKTGKFDRCHLLDCVPT